MNGNSIDLPTLSPLNDRKNANNGDVRPQSRKNINECGNDNRSKQYKDDLHCIEGQSNSFQESDDDTNGNTNLKDNNDTNIISNSPVIIITLRYILYALYFCRYQALQ